MSEKTLAPNDPIFAACSSMRCCRSKSALLTAGGRVGVTLASAASGAEGAPPFARTALGGLSVSDARAGRSLSVVSPSTGMSTLVSASDRKSVV